MANDDRYLASFCDMKGCNLGPSGLNRDCRESSSEDDSVITFSDIMFSPTEDDVSWKSSSSSCLCSFNGCNSSLVSLMIRGIIKSLSVGRL